MQMKLHSLFRSRVLPYRRCGDFCNGVYHNNRFTRVIIKLRLAVHYNIRVALFYAALYLTVQFFKRLVIICFRYKELCRD